MYRDKKQRQEQVEWSAEHKVVKDFKQHHVKLEFEPVTIIVNRFVVKKL